MMGCFGNLLQKVVKLVCPVRIDRDVASVEQGRLVAVCQQCDQWLVGGRNGTGILWEFPFLRPFHDTLIGASGDNPLLPVILPEEEIEQEPDTGASSNTITQGIVFNGFRFSVMITNTSPRMVTQYNMMNIIPTIHCMCMSASISDVFYICQYVVICKDRKLKRK